MVISIPSNASFSIQIDGAGSLRRAEPLSASLPFAQGALREPRVALARGGKPIPAQFSILARWSDGSIRWLLARFQTDVPANGRANVLATPGQSSAARGPALARKRGEELLIDTGALKARLGRRAAESSLLKDSQGDSLLSDGPRLVIHTEAGRHEAQPSDTIELEENGPLYASVFLAGPILPKVPNLREDRKEEPVFRYETRLHFWKDKAQVLAEHTVVCVGGPPVTVVDGIVVEMKAAAPLKRYAFGGAKEPHAGSLDGRDFLRLQQNCAFWQECLPGYPSKYLVMEKDFSYRLTRNGRYAARGSKSPGWLWAGGRASSIGVAVQNFWEEGPKGLSLSSDGKIEVELYAHWQPAPDEARPERVPTADHHAHPNLKEWFRTEDQETVARFLADTKWPGPVRRGPMRFGRTRAKTTDVLYLFGTGNERKETALLAARRSPVLAVVDPEYLCATRALNFIWKPAAASGLPNLERGLLGALRNWQKHSQYYGFLHYGDDQCGTGFNDTVPSTFYNHEYDTTRCLLQQFARTGLADYLAGANRVARHVADVDQYQLSGEIHFHGYHAGGEYHEEAKRPDMGGHIYLQGLVDHFALTGDRRSLRAFERAGQALLGYGKDAKAKVGKIDQRALARPGVALLAIYDLTRDPKYLAPVKAIVEELKRADDRRPPEGAFIWPTLGEVTYHVEELLARYHQATGDAGALASLRKSLDRRLREQWKPDKRCFMRAGQTTEPAEFSKIWFEFEHGFVFAYSALASGDKRYLEPFKERLGKWGVGWEKSFGNFWFTRFQLWSVPFVSLYRTVLDQE